MFSLNPSDALLAGFLFGMVLTFAIIRRIGKSSRNSKESFYWFRIITSYKPHIYIVTKPDDSRVDRKKVDNTADYQDIMLALKGQFKFSPSQAKEATEYAMEKIPFNPLEDKIKEALSYLGGNGK